MLRFLIFGFSALYSTQAFAEKHCSAASFLSTENVDLDAKDIPLRLVAKSPDRLRITSVVDVDAACAAEIQSYRARQVLLNGGRVFELSQETAQPLALTSSIFINSAGDAVPKALRRKGLLSQVQAYSARAGSSGSQSSLGLWRVQSEYVVTNFEGRASSPATGQALIVSKAPIRSLSFFPFPEAKSGNIALTVMHGSGAKLVTIEWISR